ncbi:AAA family ATPase, partial [Schleiferiaceae bacterium]|nr:AAA family ATPase [Schleiferiaceae bacterium]
IIIGQEEAVDLITMSILCQGHSLLVGVPGLAKTLLITSVSQALGLDFARIQFTPDLMPSDITGTEVLNAQREFIFHKGPVFSNVVLADEINRTPPKTQAALLEAMQEKKVSAAGKTMDLPKPFFVLATQNPIEQEGTYPLPEAQLDRFLFNIFVDYPALEEERAVVRATTIGSSVIVNPVLSSKEVLDLQFALRAMPVTDAVVEYAVELARKTRPGKEGGSTVADTYFSWGAGPRASQNMVLAAKALAMMHGEGTPSTAHVKQIAPAVLRHRVVINYKAKGEGLTVDALIGQLL